MKMSMEMKMRGDTKKMPKGKMAGMMPMPKKMDKKMQAAHDLKMRGRS